MPLFILGGYMEGLLIILLIFCLPAIAVLAFMVFDFKQKASIIEKKNIKVKE